MFFHSLKYDYYTGIVFFTNNCYLQKEKQMKNLRLFAVLLGIILVFAPQSFAEDKSWGNQAELSFVDTGGNTDLMSVSGKNLLTYKFNEKFKGAWKIAALYGETDGEKNAESYLTELRLDYLITEKLFAYGVAGWMKDEFAGIKAKYYLGPGVGYVFLNGPKNFLSAEAGVNYTSDEYTDNTERDYAGGRTFAKYEYAFTEKNRLSQSAEFLYDFDDNENYVIISETALKSAINDSLSLKASYIVTYDNQPVPKTLEETDTILALTLVVNF